MTARVLVAMSGGVDSSVAAALLQAEGYDIVGVTLHLWDYPDDGSTKAAAVPRKTSTTLAALLICWAFPLRLRPTRTIFEQEVVAPFVESYLAGETPSPVSAATAASSCASSATLADRLDAPYVATGHYARQPPARTAQSSSRPAISPRIRATSCTCCRRQRSLDSSLPLGDLDKQTVRKKAQELALPGAQKGESQELCFVPTGRYDELVQARAPERVRPGPILAPDGRVLGQHTGVHTLHARATKEPGRRCGRARVRRRYRCPLGHGATGPSRRTSGYQFRGRRVDLAGGGHAPAVGRGDGSLSRPKVAARAVPDATGLRTLVTLSEPVTAPTVGQYAVFYEGSRVLGGGAIARKESHGEKQPVRARSDAPSSQL